MKRQLLPLIVALSLPMTVFASAPAPDDCALNFEEFRAPLDERSRAWKSIRPAVKNEQDRMLTQSAELKTGVKVEFRGGGCAHLAYSFTFPKIKVGSPARNLRVALRLLRKVPVVPERKEMKENLVHALETALKNPPKEGKDLLLACGDANCALTVNEDASLRVSYDFAL